MIPPPSTWQAITSQKRTINDPTHQADKASHDWLSQARKGRGQVHKAWLGFLQALCLHFQEKSNAANPAELQKEETKEIFSSDSIINMASMSERMPSDLICKVSCKQVTVGYRSPLTTKAS